MREPVMRLLALLLFAGLLGPATAQEVPTPTDSLPPLPDSLRLYGATLPTGANLPPFDAPADAQPLSLDEAVRLALARSPGLAASALEAERAANDAVPGNAGYLPTLDATGSVIGTRADDAGAAVRASTVAGAELGAGYTLFDASRSATLRRLQADARRFRLLAEADAEALAYAVTQAYLDAARQQALVESRQQAVTLSEDRLRIEQSEVQIGTAAEIDAALALADLNADRAALLRQQLLLAQARATLGGLLTLPDPEAVLLTDSLALGPPPPLVPLASAITTGNRRVEALRVAAEVAEEITREVRGEYLPTVRATAGVGVGAAAPGFIPNDLPVGGTDLRYGLTATLPIFDAGSRRRRAENAQLRVRQAELDVADAQAALRADAARLTTAIEGYRALAALETQNEAIAEQNARVALAQLRLGFITALDLRQVQLALLDVQARRIEAVYQAERAEAELRLLAGQLLPD